MTDVIARFRKKYMLTLLIFIAGTAHSFVNGWSAGEFTNFATLLLGIFGAADLVDKDKVGFLAKKAQ